MMGMEWPPRDGVEIRVFFLCCLFFADDNLLAVSEKYRTFHNEARHQKLFFVYPALFFAGRAMLLIRSR